jgi:VIT1/CCC1 family predicted Fe2+/Mn2+ transporter
MPKLSEGVLQAIKIDINIKTNDDVHQFKGKIAGFSNRLNTILVPDEFMKMANETYAPHRESHVSRVVLQVDNPTDDRITSYLQDNNYETDEDKLDASKTNYLLKILVAVVIAVGAVISILAFFILMLSIYLLVEKNSSKLENLLLLGYSTAKVARPYQILTILLNILVALLAVLAVIGFRKIYLNLFIAFFPDMTTPPVTITFVAAACICTLMSVVNFLAIKRKVNSIWNNKS